MTTWLNPAKLVATFIVVASFAFGTAGALTIPSAPPLDKPIIDQTTTLSEDQVSQLSQQIAESRLKKPYQIGVLMIPTLDDRDIESYSIEVARKWGIGGKGKNNGVLLVVAKDDRKLRIEVGSGLEGDLTDAESGRIIRNTITPKFKSGDFYGGIRDGVESIQANVEGRADPNAGNESGGDMAELILGFGAFLIWGFVWLMSILARSKSWWAGGILGGIVGTIAAVVAGGVLWSFGLLVGLVSVGLGLDWLVSRNYKQSTSRGEDAAWWAGGGSWGGGSSGSSGGSFGGGGFSGGGSSGSW